MFATYLASYLKLAMILRLLGGLLFVLVGVAALCTPSVAFGQSEADRATARNLAAEGYTALKTQDFTTAEDRFRRADALVHAPTLVVDHARALIGLGRYVEAQERLELVLREGVPESAPWVWKKSVQDAEQLVGEVKPKVSWLTIYVKGPGEPLVMIDGALVPVAALGVRRATDPGPRRISATATGYLPKEITVALPEGSERAVTLELGVDPGTPRAVAAPPPQSSPHRQRSNSPKPPSNTLAYAALGLGGTGVVIGAVTGAMFLGVRSDLKKHCPNRTCPAPSKYGDYEQLHSNYVTYGTVSGVAWTVGLASSVAGLWLLLSDKPKENVVRARQAQWFPYVTDNSVGMTGAF
jgi:hypothetical protein